MNCVRSKDAQKQLAQTSLSALKRLHSLRSKRFRRAFRPLEALFAFWLPKNWGERNTDGSSERAESLTETLATQAIFKGTQATSVIAYMVFRDLVVPRGAKKVTIIKPFPLCKGLLDTNI